MRAPSPSAWARVHLALTAAWALLMVPSLLWWQESVPWLVTMSCYANVAGSAASWMAARADRDSPTREDLERVERKLEALGHRLGRR
jgi:membrane protein YqaA with SNARE-associated domain